MHKTLLSIVLYVSFGAAGCGGSQAHDNEGHVHTAPHDGVLVVCADHVANVEVVLDADAGELTLYLLDGHAEGYVRTPQMEIGVSVTVGDETFVVNAAAQDNKQTTGETVGDTSEFSVQDDRFTGVTEFSGTLQKVEMRGETYESLAFTYPAEHDDDHDE